MDSGTAYYYKITGLMVPTHDVPGAINANIDAFIDRIEQHTSTLEEEWQQNSIAEFMQTLEKIQELLRKVYAKWHEADGNAILRTARNEGLEKCRPLIKPFVTNLLALSIEMQKAQNEAKTSIRHEYSEAEKNEEIARSFSAVSKLLFIAEYDKAQSIIASMKENKIFNVNDRRLGDIARLIDAHEYKQAAETAAALHKEYAGRIGRTGVSSVEILKTVLAVDDVPEILSGVNAALTGHYKVLGAPGGQAALQIMQKINIDLFILDIDMPAMDGYELTEKIRTQKSYAQTPVMYLTATSSRERILKSMQLGIKDFIVKPAYNETLLAKVGKYLI